MVNGMVGNAGANGRSFGRRRRYPFGRGNERGAAIFVVLLVVAVLTGLGVFAAHMAGLNQRLSGYAWQSSLSMNAAELGTFVVAGDLSTSAASAYMQLVLNARERCSANDYAGEAGEGAPCYRLTSDDVRRRLQAENSVAPELFDTGQTLLAGQGLVGDFVIELTDPTPLQRPVPGMDQGGTGPRFRYMQLTLTGIGRVGPAHQQGNGTVTAASRGTAIRANRAIVQVGPLPY